MLKTPGLVSVILPCPGRLAATRRGVSALLRHTRPPWELIAVVPEASRATRAYLAGVRDAAPVRVEVVSMAGAVKSCAAWHHGLGEARGGHVALLEARTIVTDAWLDQLVALAGSDRTIGMVGPMSNAAPPAQRVDESPGDDLDGFASRWRAGRRGSWSRTESLGGPCLLLKRGVLEAIRAGRAILTGGLRPDRLSARVRRAGFSLAVAKDLYIHRWMKIRGPGSDVLTEVPRRRLRVSLTMIVRDEQENLPACLASAADLFDEIVVLDTGSADRTVEIARSFGARVFDFVWVYDFAAARNAALARATGDYAFWLDADDRVEPPQRERLRTLFDGLRSADSAYVVRCASDPDPDSGGSTVVDHVRLFPVREDVRWSYRVHEQILPSLRKAGVGVRWAEATVRHVGYNDPAVRRRKRERNLAILVSELAERPEDPFVLFHLGQVALESDDPRGALSYLRRSLARSEATDSIVRKLHGLIAQAHQQMGEPAEALVACEAGLASDPDDAELLFRKGILHRLRCEPAEAPAGGVEL
jgi:GT2 family glycosyltransferase